MNYELCKKLKEAGFPFKKHHLGILHLDVTTPANYPTLSELIEACGEEFRDLRRIKEGLWDAWGGKQERYEHNYKYVEGSTSEEAVANLWLKLNG